jgi:hypothetical protein
MVGRKSACSLLHSWSCHIVFVFMCVRVRAHMVLHSCTSNLYRSTP